MKLFLLGFILIFFCGCSPTQSKLQTPTPPVISTPPVSSSNARPTTNTAASTASPSPVPVVQICSPHIHAVAVGDAELSYAAYLQIHGSYGYLAGMDGLPLEEGSDPAIDPHGGPVICNWMEE
ncbi:MAG: hypothetical protein LLG42_10045 [Chloroflexi bacterium]|nr:hypothetical protein [Chloroflexota bacterium]